MDNKLASTIAKGYFIVIAVMMYYFITEVINLGLFVSFRHAFALVLFASALFAFLYKPNVARGVASVNSTLVYCLPLLITVVVSMFIWFVEQVDTSVIARGLSGLLVNTNMLSFTFAAVAFLYVFGEKGIWYNLIAILISNILMLATIILQNGFGSFFSEFVTLVVTFAGETGDVIVQAEIHELAFCLGAYLIYMFLHQKKNITFFILLALTGFCFLTAFKRIGIIAIAIALMLGWLLKLVAKLKKETAIFLTVLFSVIMIVVLIGYVAIIKMDVFALIEEAGIDTSGRVVIYDAVDKYYEFSPEFMGRGIGFLTYQLSSNMDVSVAAVHNDFLQYFIDLGFWGYILWLVSMFLVRVCYFGRKGQTDGAILALVLSLYLVIVSSTDNTMNYPLLTTVLAILMIGHGYDEKVRMTEIKMFGHVSDVNKATEGETML